jgi:hypothetical protein
MIVIEFNVVDVVNHYAIDVRVQICQHVIAQPATEDSYAATFTSEGILLCQSFQ